MKVLAIEELVVHQETGLLFEQRSASALLQAASALARRSELHDVRRRTRREFDDKYSAEQSYRRLMSIYQRTVERHWQRESRPRVVRSDNSNVRIAACADPSRLQLRNDCSELATP